MTYVEAVSFAKTAAKSPVTEGAIGYIPNTALNMLAGPLGVVPSAAGTITAALQSAPSNGDMVTQGKQSPVFSAIPGMSDYQLMRRRKGLSRELGGKNSTIWSEALGPAVSILAASALGMAAGAGVGTAIRYNAGRASGMSFADALNNSEDEGLLGAGIGAGVGLGAGLLGAISAAATKRRSMAEQKAYEQNPSLAANYLVPGKGTYNWYKSLGASGHLTGNK